MINYAAVFVANGICLCLITVLLTTSRAQLRSPIIGDRLFYSLCFMDIVFPVLDIITFVLDGKPYGWVDPALRILNMLGYSGSAVFGLVWLEYLDFKLYGDLDRMRRNFRYYAIPSVLMIILSIANCFTDIIFTIDADNVYHRLPAMAIAYVLMYINMVYSVIYVLVKRRKAARYMFMPVLSFMAPLLIGSIIQYFHYGLSLNWIGIAIGLVSLYISAQNETSLVDSLTLVYNRECLTRYVQYLVQKSEKGRYGGIMMDLDDFKAINDTYGHSEGDDVLRTVGRILVDVLGESTFIARFGGDEFIAIRTVEGDEDIRHMIDSIGSALDGYNASSGKPYSISMSIGGGTIDFGDASVDSFMREIDAHMYQDKERHRKDRTGKMQ